MKAIFAPSGDADHTPKKEVPMRSARLPKCRQPGYVDARSDPVFFKGYRLGWLESCVRAGQASAAEEVIDMVKSYLK
jgi:hypothetical protein